MAAKNGRIKLDRRDAWFHFFNDIFLGLCIVLIVVPLLNVVSSAISAPSDVLNGRVLLWPKHVTLTTFSYVFKDKNLMSGYWNSIVYMVVGTVISVTVTMLAAYPLSRKELRGKQLLMFLFTFTMYFSGGMVPTFLVIRQLRMIDSIWAVVLPNALSAYNLIIARTFLTTSIPSDLYEAAEIDGAGDWRVFRSIVLPLSNSILAVMTLLYAVGLWNLYFDAILYLNSSDKYPLQVVLRNIMTSAQMQSSMVEATGAVQSGEMLAITESLKYTSIVCASVPMLLLYPLIQKHFSKGMMIGSIKG